MDEPIKINILNNEVSLDEKCSMCNKKWCKDKNGICTFCNGTGYRLTYIGQSIIGLVTRHVK